jgi:hypothetical protein
VLTNGTFQYGLGHVFDHLRPEEFLAQLGDGLQVPKMAKVVMGLIDEVVA